MPTGSAEVGSTANSYEVIAKLATGGMAEIFLARSVNAAGVERYVVLKRVLRERADDAHFVTMFLDEARLAAQLQHPNIAQVYDVGKLGDSYFFTMEYVHGETVRSLLARSHGLRRPIPVAIVLSIIAGAAAGLHHAHERKGVDGRPLGIVHRDVSPSNLMISFEGHVKVVDFGVAKAAHRSHETQSGTVKGKITYLSPEQARGNAALDRRSDLFSLGIVMWELLTLERMFRRESDFENMFAIISEPPRPPSSARHDIAPELDALVLRMLAKDPAERFQTADELHAALEELALRQGSALSSSGLARYLRELFGERPEPWVEMRSQESHGPAVTVTSEPIPPQLVATVAHALDAQLGAVPLLSDSLLPGAPPRAPSQRVTVPVSQIEPGDLVETEREPSRPALAPTIRMSRPSQPPMMTAPYPAPSYPVVQRAAEPARRNSRIGVVIGIAGVLGVAIALAIVLSGEGGPPSSAPALASHDAQPVAIASPTPAPPAPPPAASAPDAAVVAAAPPVVEPSHDKPHTRAKLPSSDEIAKQFHAEHYVDVVLACSTSGAVVAQDPAVCVLSACHLHDLARAQKWLKAAGGKRASLVAGCAQVGTPLEAAKPPPSSPPPPAKDCAANPLDCQH